MSKCVAMCRWLFCVWIQCILCGLGSGQAAVGDLVGPGTVWRYWKGLSEASSPDPAAWRLLGFDASGWGTGSAPFSAGLSLAGTELADRPGQYTTLFLRQVFTATNAAEAATLQFDVRIEDGLAVWINGREALRVNVPAGPLGFDSLAVEEVSGPLSTEHYVVTNAFDYLVTGTNVIAVQVFSAGRGDDDFAFDLALAAEWDTTAPEVQQIEPEAGTRLDELTSVEIHFSEPVRGLEPEDLLINNMPATNVSEVAPGQYLFTFPQPADGPVTVGWRAAHGIRDDVGHPFGGSNWSYSLDTGAPELKVSISEFMSDNRRTLHDEEGDDSDWIELFNGGENEISLSGWFLTDDATNLTKWRFPDTGIAGRGYLVVFASEKNKTNTAGRLHTNFKLSNEGEYLALVSPSTNVISAFQPVYPKQFADVSYGRVGGEGAVRGYFVKPTPGAANADSGPGFAPPVGFSRSSGAYIDSFQLALSVDSANAEIRYTLNGLAPANGSALYASPLAITNSVEVRTRAFEPGLLPGPIRSETFLFLSNNVVGFTSTLPVMVIHSLGGAAPSSGRHNYAHISLYEPVHGRTSLTNPPSQAWRAGIKLRGSSTEGLPKSSFALEIWDELNMDRDVSILGLPEDSDWVLYAPNQYEPVLIHNPFIHQLSRETGLYSPRTRFVEVYLNKNRAAPPGNLVLSAANYSGIYVLEEKIKIGKNRVDIDKLQPEHLRPPEVTGGYLLKIDRLDPLDSGFSGGGATVAYVDPKEREIKLPQRDPQEQYIRNYFAAFGKALAAPTFRDPQIGYPAYIDAAAWIDYHILEVLSGNVDALVLSTYFHKPRNGKIVFGPHWDFDRALGSTDGRDRNPRIWNTGPFFSGSWWSRLFGDKDFWQLWIDRWQEWRQAELSLKHMNALIDQLVGEIIEAQPRERKRWPLGYRREDGRSGGTYQTEVQWMKNWISNRVSFIDGQLAERPRLSVTGGKVVPGAMIELSADTNATIFYTLDGTDPRVSQGNVATNALVYSGPIQIDRNARLVARARNLAKRQTGGPPSASSTPWSGPVAATYVVATPPLLLTEIMFHPPPPPAGSTNLPSDFEFLEFKNGGNQTLELAGFILTNGVRFEFGLPGSVTRLGPGERVLVVKNRAAFLSRYPGAIHIAGEFSGELANDNNRLTLLGPMREPIADFRYDQSWGQLADGFGFSLVLQDENTVPELIGDPQRWRVSAVLGGSPGAPDSPAPPLPRVLITELLSRTRDQQSEAVELFNPQTSAADVSGWFLSDDWRTPKKYRLPAQSQIPPSGFLVIKESEFEAGAAGFRFSAQGDEVYLFSADANGNLTGYSHGFGFGASEAGLSFGRYVTSDGREHFAAEKSRSFNRSNVGPRVGPLVVTQILADPPSPLGGNDTEAEFIELVNISGQPLLLFDPAHATNTWRLRGAVDFDFPPGTVIPPGGHAVVTAFDPRDKDALARFNQLNEWSAGVAVFGPWSGHLDNRGDVIRLLKPDWLGAQGAGATLYVLVEEIEYSDAAPWPAIGPEQGLALSRRHWQEFGNDPANWTATLPHTGDPDSDGDGLPDRWEIEYQLDPATSAGAAGPGGDPDGDGFSNWQELLAGTNPNDRESLPRLRIIPGGNGGLEVQFPGAPGRVYTLESRESLSAGAWNVRQRVRGLTRGPLTIKEGSTNQTRFYRLRVP